MRFVTLFLFTFSDVLKEIKLPVTVYSLAVVALEVRVRFQISDGISFTQANKSNVFTTSFCVPKLASTSRQVTIEFTRLGAQTIKADIEGFQSSECLDDFYEVRGCWIGCSFSSLVHFDLVLLAIGCELTLSDWRHANIKATIITSTRVDNKPIKINMAVFGFGVK